MAYEKTVRAALDEMKSKFALAEALHEEVREVDHASLEAQLREAASAIHTAGGDAKSWETLRGYRQVAAWVWDGAGAVYRWIPGVTFTAHVEASKCMTYEEFLDVPTKRVREMRIAENKASKDGSPSKVLPSWSTEQKIAAAKEILVNKDLRDQVLRDEAVRGRAAASINQIDEEERIERARNTAKQPVSSSLAALGFTGTMLAILAKLRDARPKVDLMVDAATEFPEVVENEIKRLDEIVDLATAYRAVLQNAVAGDGSLNEDVLQRALQAWTQE